MRGMFRHIVGSSSEEIAFVKNNSDGVSFVAAGFLQRNGDSLVSGKVEYHSNVYPLMRTPLAGISQGSNPR